MCLSEQDSDVTMFYMNYSDSESRGEDTKTSDHLPMTLYDEQDSTVVEEKQFNVSSSVTEIHENSNLNSVTLHNDSQLSDQKDTTSDMFTASHWRNNYQITMRRLISIPVVIITELHHICKGRQIIMAETQMKLIPKSVLKVYPSYVLII